MSAKTRERKVRELKIGKYFFQKLWENSLWIRLKEVRDHFLHRPLHFNLGFVYFQIAPFMGVYMNIIGINIKNIEDIAHL